MTDSTQPSSKVLEQIYTDGTYLDKNPLWHTDESPFKVQQILRMTKQNNLLSPQAMEMCKSRVNDRLQFKLADISQEPDAFFDMLLVLDVVEHVEDYFGFLQGIRPKGDLKLFHFPLDLSVQAVVRQRSSHAKVVLRHASRSHRPNSGWLQSARVGQVKTLSTVLQGTRLCPNPM